MSLIITDAEVADILGITVTTSLTKWNLAAHALMEGEIGVSDFLTHTVTDERIKPFRSDYMILNDFPVTAVSAIKDIGFSSDTYFDGATFFLDPKEIRRVRAKDGSESPLYFCNKEYLITYTAGYATANAAPQDLKNAIAMIVSSGVSESESAQGVKTKKLGDFSITYEIQMGEFMKKSALVSSVVSKYGNFL